MKNIIFLTLVYGSTGFTQDTPNQKFEQFMHEVYQKQQPVDDAQWQQLTSRQGSNLYVIQTGDTLWDLSKTLFGDGFFWSKLWAENDAIYNPHRISPSQEIKFIAGTESTEPQISVETPPTDALATNLKPPKREEVKPPTFKEDIEKLDDNIDKDALLPKPEIPQAKKRQKPLKALPSSFVQIQMRPKGYNAAGVQIIRNPPVKEDPVSFLPCFITDANPTAVGKIVDIEGSDLTAAHGQFVIVEGKRTMSVGEKFTLYSIRNEHYFAKGYVVDVGGIVEITETVDNDKHIYKGQIVGAVGPIPSGAIVSEEPLAKIDASAVGPKSNIQARIIGGEFERHRETLGEFAVVFLDKGQDDGLRMGDLLGVRRNSASGLSRTLQGYENRSIGIIKIVRVEPKYATGIVVRAVEEITTGDETGVGFPKNMPELKETSAEFYHASGGTSGGAGEIDIPDTPKPAEGIDEEPFDLN